jgi:hypothetical protein
MRVVVDVEGASVVAPVFSGRLRRFGEPVGRKPPEPRVDHHADARVDEPTTGALS